MDGLIRLLARSGRPDSHRAIDPRSRHAGSIPGEGDPTDAARWMLHGHDLLQRGQGPGAVLNEANGSRDSTSQICTSQIPALPLLLPTAIDVPRGEKASA